MSGNLVNVRPKPGFVMDASGAIVPARSGHRLMMQFLGDRLTNVMSGMGTAVDKAAYAGYNFLAQSPQQVESSYRSSWLMRKIVDLPPLDMTRAWRSWQTDAANIEKLEAEERRLQLKAKVKRALVLARLWGGSVIIMGIKGDADPAQELNPAKANNGGLQFLHVFARHQVTIGQMITDPVSPYFGQPEYYEFKPVVGREIRIHPSRAIPFIGQPVPEGSFLMGADWLWGDPLYQAIASAIQNADLAQNGFASLIDEAKIDIVKMPQLMETWAADEYESKLMDRLAAAKMGKSTWRTLLLDGDEEWDQRETTWTGIPDIIIAYLQLVAGAADIPVTRLLGQSPKGLQSTGEGEEKDYHAMIEARQDELLCPALDKIDQCLIPSALGSTPSDVWWKFESLERLTKTESADVELKRSQAVNYYSQTGLIDSVALGKMAENAINESGAWPGSEKAFEEAASADPAADPNVPPEALMTPQEIAAAKAKAAQAANDGSPLRIMDIALADGEPRSLYVSRKLLNADELIRWAKGQGFDTTQPASQMHVTVAFSRKPVDWMQIGEDWSSDADGKIRVKPGGPRTVERLGDKGAVALMFRSDALEYRHQAIHSGDNGAQWDWPTYQPHVTISWNVPADFDLAKVEPFNGPLVFGPEIFAEVVDDWETTIEES